MPLDTNFDVSPFFDDYDPQKKYYRILYRPSVAVQARELTQTQTIIQNQIERFAGGVYTDGSRIDGCSPTIIPNLQFVRIQDKFIGNNDIFINDIPTSYLLVGNTSGVRATIEVAKEGLFVNYPNTNRFYIKYISTGNQVGNVNYTTFANGEYINIYNDFQDKFSDLDPTNIEFKTRVITTNSSIQAVGKGYGFKIENGIIYQKGYFQNIDEQKIVIRDYDQNVSNTLVGFETIEQIVTENQDPSLNDNALGYPNENAPGAYRLKLNPVIIAREKQDIANNDAFFAIFQFSNITGELIIDKSTDPYSAIGDFVAKRTYDEAGDFVSKPFLVEAVQNDDPTLITYQVSSGKGYVHGYQVEYTSSRAVDAPKATTTNYAINQIITANYGNFVRVQEFAGIVPLVSLPTINIYRNPIQAITNNYPGSVSPASNPVVGTAKVKSIVYDSGVPGTPTCTYKLYLTDIEMLSGYSFAGNARGFGLDNGPYGDFWADAVVVNNKTILDQTGKLSLVLPYGKKALKTLFVNGDYDTSFYFRNSVKGQLLSNGFISITTSSSHPGGYDVIGYSPGVLGDTLENQFIITLENNVATDNFPGVTANVFVNNSNYYANISSGQIASYFYPGEFMYIGGVGYRVENIVNNSTVQLAGSPTVTASTAFGKYWPAGYSVPLENNISGGDRYVNVTSPTTLSVISGVGNTSAPLTSSANAIVQFRMERYSAQAAKKDVIRNVYIKINTGTNPGGINGPWKLGIPDVFGINNVWADANDYSTAIASDVTNYFELDTGQKDEFYDYSQLVIKPQFANALTGTPYIVVSVDVFKINSSTGIGFFSVDSYPTSNVSPTPNSYISWAEIPIYNSGAVNYDLRDCIDIRAVKSNTANYATDLAAATINPPDSSAFVSDSTSYLTEPDTNITSSVEYFLGRIDLITIGASGSLSVAQGVPSERPTVPTVDVDAMSICTAYVAPFPTLSLYGRPDYAVKTKISYNRVYTMRDIGVLDQRIQRLEYYNTLNLLEQQAKTLQVPDSNGLNRFKNGFFADPMNSHAFGDVSNIEYRWSIDSMFGYGRPMYSSENINLVFNGNLSAGVVQTGRYITLPYTHELIINQPFATKVRNNAQDAWAWTGVMNLFPSYDMNRDETMLPAQDARIDLTQPFAEFANAVAQATGATVFGTRYGDWRTLSSSTVETRVRNYPIVTVTDTTTSQQDRTVTNTFTVPITQTFDIGTYVTDVSIQPYMKSRTIAFVAGNLKPNTRVYPFFDTVAVANYTAPGALNTALGNTIQQIVATASTTGKPDAVCNRTGNFGDPLITDSTGTLYGVFLVPDGQFRTGDRTLLLMDQNDYVTGANAAITSATAVFTASNISVTKRDSTITTVTPSVRSIQSVQDRTLVTASSYSYIDPLAQSFNLDAPQEQSGVFVTKIDLFFKTKDNNYGVTVVLSGMTNGFPDSNKVYGTSYVAPSNINLSDDATAATTFVFDQPIFVNAGDQYAFYIEPEANSPEYSMWMSEIGGTDVTTGAQVYTNPYAGDAFRSSNAKSWTVLTREDIKFSIYCANFVVGSGTAVFENENDEWIKYAQVVPFASDKVPQVGDEIFVLNSPTDITIPNTSITGIIQSIDEDNTTYKLDSSIGGFLPNTTLGVFRLPQNSNSSAANASTLISTFTLDSFVNPVLDAIVPSFATMLPVGASINLSYAGTAAQSGAKDQSYIDLDFDIEKEMIDYERAVFSKSLEMTLVRTKSLTVNAVFQNTNKYLSPVIDLTKKHALVIENKINNDNTNEYTRYGSAIAKYVSQSVVLADGQDAEDLKVYITGYRPYNTDIEIYVKFLANEDSDLFQNKVWTKLDNDDIQLYCNPLNTTDFKEFTYSVPKTPPVSQAAYINQDTGVIQYLDASGAVYATFKTFAIKIVLLSQSRIYVPKIDDLRAIALQV